MNLLDVCLGTKIRILKQITTDCLLLSNIPRCLSWHKDTNFKANHNALKNVHQKTKMFVLAQRYEF